MPLLADDFVPAWGLSNGHLNTVFSTLTRRGTPAQRRERVETPDGDFFDLDLVDGEAGRPTVLLLHGLEGSSSSGYMRLLLGLCAARRWTGVAMNFRSCSGEPNRKPESYHSGEVRDVQLVLERLARPTFVVGYSLGGSVLLNLLAQRGGAGNVAAAAAVGTPFDLAACCALVDGPDFMARRYRNYFLPTMKAKTLEKAARFPTRFDAAAIRAVTTMRDFDHAVTAPLFGFASGADYYEQCSTAGKLEEIRVPTLLLAAEDDPITPASHLPPRAHASAHLHVQVTRYGGHVGYAAGTPWRTHFWAEHRVIDWLAQFA